MADSESNRAAERVPSDLVLEFRVPGTRKGGTGQIRDLSSTGVLFTSYENLSPGTEIQIKIPFVNAGTPPLMRPAVVVRCRVIAGGHGYAIACAFD